MADRTTAALFGLMFSMLAKNPTDEHKQMAKRLMQETGDFDFNHYQMDSDEELITLGLAHKGINPDYPEDGEVIIYAPPATT